MDTGKLSDFSLALSLLDTWNIERVIVLYLRVYKLPFKSLVLMSTVCLLFFVNRFCFFVRSVEVNKVDSKLKTLTAHRTVVQY